MIFEEKFFKQVKDSAKKDKIYPVIMYGIVLILSVVCIGYSLYFLLSIFSTNPFSLNIIILLISILFFSYLVGISCKTIKNYEKIDNFLMVAIILSVLMVSFGYTFLFSYYSPYYYPQQKYDEHNLNITYNPFNRNRPNDFTLRGDTFCYNISIKNNNPSNVNIFMGDYISTPNGKTIPENITVLEYDILAFNLSSNETKISETFCRKLTEPGLNNFFPFLMIAILDERGISIKVENFYINGFTEYVYTESEYFDIINNRNFAFIMALATIPIVLSSVKTIRDLYNN